MRRIISLLLLSFVLVFASACISAAQAQQRGYLGVVIQRVTPEIAELIGMEKSKGALVADVAKGGPADVAGVKIGDVIIEFDGDAINVSDKLPRLVALKRVNSKVRVRVLRDKKEVVLLATIEPPKGQATEETREVGQPEGAIIATMEPGSPAANAGLRQGDIILEVDRKRVRSFSDYQKVVAENERGVTLLLVRRGERTAFFVLKRDAKGEAEAARWWRKAAEQGDVEAQSHLGMMYANGRGVPKDEVEAVRWFRKAAKQGDEDARKSLERLKDVVKRVEAEEQLERSTQVAEQAEQSGKLREALNHYVTALQSGLEGSGVDRRVREKIIKLVHQLDPPPAISEDARRHFIYAQTAAKTAKSPSDYEKAIKEYQEALRLAPWWGNFYLDLAIVQEQAGKYADAARSLELFVLASPNDPQARAAKNRIYELEYKAKANR